MAPTQSQQDNNPSAEYKLKKYLLLLATLVVTVTYVAGLNLPGGVWQDNDRKGGLLAGELILLETHYGRYLTFYYCNATAFAASVVVCLLLLILEEGNNNGVCGTVLRVVMVLDLLGLMGAYAAGSCRDAFTTIYSILVMSAVLAYVVLDFSLYVISKLEKCKGGNKPPQKEEDHESQSQSQSREEEHEVASSEVLMLLATFVVTITYDAGLSPPGGFWSDTKDASHRLSFPILQDHSPARYQAFFVCNTTALVASLLIIMLLLDKRLKKEISVRFVALYGLIVVALFGLVGAYAAGSCRETDTTIYVVSLIGAVLAYIFLQVAITKGIHKAAQQNKRSISGTLQRGRGQDDAALEKAHDLVILLATLVASVTYQAGLDPPGGLWPDNKDGHKVGDPVLLTTHPKRYKVFFYSNSAAFVASLVVILMVKCKFLVMYRSLEAAMLVDLFGLIGAYSAGCCRDLSTSIYVVALAGAVLVYVVIHIIFFTLDTDDKHGDDAELDSRREVLLLLAILAATVTYQAGLTPPGGFWSADDRFGHHAGFPVLRDNYPSHYRAFFYCNAMSFMASVALIVLLVNHNLYRPGIRCHALLVSMVAALFVLMGAYAAGSSRQLRTSIYVLVLFALVFTCVTLWVIILIRRLMKQKGDHRSSAGDVVSTDAGTTTQQEIDKEKKKKMQMREYLMLLGVLAASVAYQSGLEPPGGLWEDNDNGHSASNSILHDIDKSRYHAFFYSNSTSFMASIVVIVLLLPYGHDELPLRPLHMAILIDLVGLLVAYAAGSTRDWEMFRNVIALVIPLLVYIASYALYTWYRRTKCSASEEKKDKQEGNSNDV